jgi:hypothetical protein
MSTAPPVQPVVSVPASEAKPKREVVVVSHSSLFYWWPVWVLGYIMAGITLLDHHYMTTVPSGAAMYAEASGTLKGKTGEKQEVQSSTLTKQDVIVAADEKSRFEEPHLYMTSRRYLGVVYSIVLLLVITITNVPLRGLWSVIVIVVIVMLSIIFALMGIWEDILKGLSFLDIRINMAGYLFISTVLLGVWLVVFFLFDRQVYMIFTPGSLRVQLEIGDGETAYDTIGMTIQKQRSDLFRHWILGLGSGDLIVRTAGAQAHHFDLPNVLSLGRRVREIEELLRMKQVVNPTGTV